MRRIQSFLHLSPDGFVAGPDGDLDWFVHDDEVGADSAESRGTTDTILLGRRTYEMFAGFWPQAADNPSLSAAVRSMGRWLTDTPKVVFSRTLTSASWVNTRIVRELDPAAIAAMKREPGKDLILLGSGSIVAQLTEHGLIDDYQLLVHPILLGAGRPLFRDLPVRTKLTLAGSKPYRSGSVMLRYARGD